MTGEPDPKPLSLRPVARFSRLRALAWSGNRLYASRGYDLLCAEFPSPTVVSQEVIWNPIATHRPQWWRSLSVRNRLSSRLFRDGFHALAVLPSSAMVAAVPGAIVTCDLHKAEFCLTHRIARGTRPLHITALPNGSILWGEYFDNPSREEVHIYSSTDAGLNWEIAYTFPRGAIRHVHNIVHDPWAECLWILTGDYGDECHILRASCDLSRIDVILKGNQQARAVALVPTSNGVYFASDTPLEQNFIFRLDRHGSLSKVSPINSSSINGCRVGDYVFFSTMVEPSEINTDRHVRIYGSRDAKDWNPILSWRKDFWPMRWLQYGNAFFPDGDNATQLLAVSTIGVDEDDAATTLYSPSL